MAHKAAQVAKRTQTHHTEYRHVLHNAISTVNDLAASALAKEKTTTRSLDVLVQLPVEMPQPLASYSIRISIENAQR